MEKNLDRAYKSLLQINDLLIVKDSVLSLNLNIPNDFPLN